ncbi:late secretory pathway protein AVL9 homolog isoform X2 [Lineus longissimus]|uniref:late secretory pathway protein AVL9 homolog isoform X2 n=1 Tax=Lineus longissimus TaxID=88925 RepID=UPI002B4F6D36
MSDSDSSILHVCVIGFHHKKGCQLEYSYPPLCEGKEVDSHDLPEEWKHLPSLALPDGAHNYDKDTIYFHLRSKDGSRDTVFGISCYRQMAAKDLIKRTADVTRSSVQKSVCVISKLPLYGLIQAKLELITHAYFDERDFSKVELLEQTYINLNASVSPSMIKGSQAFLGMSARDLIVQFRHKIVMLFKLILLERKVLVFLTPVAALNNILLALLSLFPGMIEHGLKEAAGYSNRRLTEFHLVGADSDEYLELSYREQGSGSIPVFVDTPDIIKSHIPRDDVLRGAHASSSSRESSPFDTDLTSITDVSNSDVQSRLSPVKCALKDVAKVDAPRSKEALVHKSSQDSLHRGDAVATVAYQRQASVGSISSIDSQNVICEQPKPMNSVSNSDGKDKEIGKRHAVYDLSVDIDAVTHVESVQLASFDNGEGGLSSPHERSNHPLEFIEDITKVEPVQETACAQLAPVSGVGPTSTEIEDLDSPESLKEIDREDCFSWEEDKLLLEIEEELDTSVGLSKEATVMRSVSEQRPVGGVSESSVADHSQVKESVDKYEKNVIEFYSEFYVPLGNTDAFKNGMTGLSHSDSLNSLSSQGSSSGHIRSAGAFLKNKLLSPLSGKRSPSKMSVDGENMSCVQRPYSPTTLEIDASGFPLSVFTKGSICHPYLPLQYYDLLEDVNIRSFLIGATNILFKQKRHLTDVVIGEDDTKIDIHDNELKRQLNLTTADLRFADYIVKNVLEDGEDLFLDGTGWEGGEEWIRVQFRLYLMALLASAEQDDEKIEEDFNPHFMRAWKTTHNYKVWQYSGHDGIKQCEPGHPFRGQMSMADMRLKWNASMQNTEKGRKINAAVHSTGRVVGGALSSAKGAISGWLSSWNKPKPDQAEDEN